MYAEAVGSVRELIRCTRNVSASFSRGNAITEILGLLDSPPEASLAVFNSIEALS